jgi:hypothetical protein
MHPEVDGLRRGVARPGRGHRNALEHLCDVPEVERVVGRGGSAAEQKRWATPMVMNVMVKKWMVCGAVTEKVWDATTLP